MTTRVLIADDHEMVRRGVAELLEGSGVEIVGEASTGKQTLRAVSRCKPDVVLLDVRMPEGDGITTVAKLKKKHPNLPVVMLSMYDNPTYIARSAAAGARDYVLKGSSREKLLSAIRRAVKGEPPAKDSPMTEVHSKMVSRTERLEADGYSLTQREFQVLRHIALGLSNKEIAKSLGISVETVKEHVQSILRKSRAVDRTQIAVWAVRQGLV